MMIVMVMVVAYKWEDVYEDEEHIMWYVQENVRLQVPEQ